jgi:hypothetical protein
MPNPADLLSLQDDEDPSDQLRMQLDQGQGANLAGAPQPPGAPSGMPQGPGPPGMSLAAPGAPAGVQGPLAALAKKPPPTRPRIKLKSKHKTKPRIKLKTSPLQGFLNAIGQ